MDRKHRVLSLLLSLVLLLGTLCTPSLAAGGAGVFSDVRASDWFYDSVGYVYENGLMNGTGNGRFSPGSATTRGMIVTILHRMEGEPGVTGKCPFSDVAAGSYYESAVTWASANGIVEGYGGGKFGPESSITREQLAAILYRYAAYRGYDTSASSDISGFSDASAVSGYAAAAMKWACAAGLMNGVGGGRLDPQGRTTRAQLSAVLMRFNTAFGGSSGSGEYTATFYMSEAGGTVYTTVKTQAGERLALPRAPQRSGYSFEGWYLRGSAVPYDATQPVTKSLSLYAQWAQQTGTTDTLYEYDPSHVAEENGFKFIDNIIIAFTRQGLSSAEKERIAAAVSGSVAGSMTEVSDILQIRVKVSTLAELEAMAAELEKLSSVYSAGVDMAGLDELVSLDAAYTDSDPWGGLNWWAKAINCFDAWREFSRHFGSVKVGVVDTGVQPDHGDLNVTFPTQTYRNSSVPNDHGTSVAGLIGAKNNSIGMCGVAYGAQLVCVDWNNLPRGTDYFAAYNAILKSGAKVINNSYGMRYISENTYKSDDDYKESRDKGIEYDDWFADRNGSIAILSYQWADYTCGIIRRGWDPLFVQSAGNGVDNKGPGVPVTLTGYWRGISAKSQTIQNLAAKYGLSADELRSHILIVGAVSNEKKGSDYLMTTYSNYGQNVDICAPGGDKNIYTTTSPSGYTSSFSGTSAAAPIVSGAAALVWSVDPSLSASEVRDILLESATCKALGRGASAGFSYPMLDVYSAVKTAVDGLGGGEAEITGRVVYISGHGSGHEDRHPLSGVTVAVENLNSHKEWTLHTDAAGVYTIRLPIGSYRFTFSCDGFEQFYGQFDVTEKHVKAGEVTMQDVIMTAAASTAGSNTLEVEFVDEDGNTIALTELFGGGESSEYGPYGGAFVALINESITEDGYELMRGGFLDQGETKIKNNRLIFEDLPDSDYYYLSFDAVMHGYDLPYSPDLDTNWNVGYITVSGGGTHTLKVKLLKN